MEIKEALQLYEYVRENDECLLDYINERANHLDALIYDLKDDMEHIRRLLTDEELIQEDGILSEYF